MGQIYKISIRKPKNYTHTHTKYRVVSAEKNKNKRLEKVSWSLCAKRMFVHGAQTQKNEMTGSTMIDIYIYKYNIQKKKKKIYREK